MCRVDPKPAHVTLRNAEYADLESLSSLAIRTYIDAFGYSFTREDLADHLQNNLSQKNFEIILQKDIVILAETTEKMVGFIQFGITGNFDENKADRNWAIQRLYVLNDFQQQGIGGLLMQAALDEMKHQKVTRIYLDVWEKNPGAIRFYQRYGFKVIQKRDFVVASGKQTSQDLIMVWESPNFNQ
ncbi:MAG: GNAT family N-acetyltransferase [Anaerolineaceae bacterium]|nr:GNAT family N-acetyltransferase [Anaerolineaceae bacterium]